MNSKQLKVSYGEAFNPELNYAIEEAVEKFGYERCSAGLNPDERYILFELTEQIEADRIPSRGFAFGDEVLF